MVVKLHEKYFPALPKGGRVLDVGAGGGKWCKMFLEAGYQVTAIDTKPRPEDLPAAIEWLQLDLTGALPEFNEGSFVGVYMRNVIQFLPRKAFTEKLLPWAKHLLAKDGVLGIETFFGMIEPPLGPKPHPAYYSSAELKTLCADMDVIWDSQFKADLKDMEGTTRLFSIAQLVAKKR